MIGLLLELITNSVILAIRFFIFSKLICVAGVQVLNSAVTTWWILIKSVARAPIDIIRSFVRWIYITLVFPIRIVTALQREKQMEMNLHGLEIKLGNLSSENRQLEYCLNASFEECRAIEAVLAKMEQEQDKALEKIELLENELQEVRQKLRDSEYEFRGKAEWDSPNKAAVDEEEDEEEELLGAAVAELSLSSMKEEEEASPGALEKQRYVALYRSTFSVVLSVVVGMIAWEAEDPCAPLVAALFTVVGLSLASVMRFFSAIRNRPAADAVALLSFNWFVLGALTSPSLPRLVRSTAPHAVRLARRLLRQLGLSSWL